MFFILLINSFFLFIYLFYEITCRELSFNISQRLRNEDNSIFIYEFQYKEVDLNSLEKNLSIFIVQNSLTTNSPAKGKSPRNSRSMRTVKDRQSTGEDNVRFHDRQTWPTLTRSARFRQLNICVSISSGSWSHISQFQLGPSSSLFQTIVSLNYLQLYVCQVWVSLIVTVKNRSIIKD